MIICRLKCGWDWKRRIRSSRDRVQSGAKTRLLVQNFGQLDIWQLFLPDESHLCYHRFTCTMERSLLKDNVIFQLLKDVYNYFPASFNTRCTKTKLIICTYWLSGKGGQENIGLDCQDVQTKHDKVSMCWLRAKYFPAKLDPTQSMSMLSYDHFSVKNSVWT